MTCSRCVRILLGGRWNCGARVCSGRVRGLRPRDPCPVVMPAIYNDVVYGSSCSSCTACHNAKLGLRGRLYEDSDVVSSAEGNGSGKCKGTIPRGGEVVTAVILEFNSPAVAEQANDHATDVESRYWTDNLHVRNVRSGCARGVAHGAVLGRTRRLRLNGDLIGCVGHKESLESK